MQSEEEYFFSMFMLSQTGVKFILVLTLVMIVLGLIAAFTKFRENLTGLRIMGLGIIFIGLAVVFSKVITFNYLISALDLYVLLIGIALSFVGACWKK